MYTTTLYNASKRGSATRNRTTTSKEYRARTLLFVKSIVFYLLLCTISLATIQAQKQTLGLMHANMSKVQSGYTLFAPMGSKTTYLIDDCGNCVHTWPSTYTPGLSVYMLDDGSILRSGVYPNPIFMGFGGVGGIVERIAWDGTVVWSYVVSTPTQIQHHDAYPMPNGNVMIICADRRTKAEAVAMGRQNLTANDVWSETLIEVRPSGPSSGDIVWEWKLWDHLVQHADSSKANFGVIDRHRELLDINFGAIAAGLPDWIHLNSVDYNADRDEIMLSSHHLSEIWIIDHSTSTEEAASHGGGARGHGGDFLYRWGNPQVYQHGSTEDQIFGNQHNAHWIAKGLVDEGRILVFNNNAFPAGSSLKYSSIDIIEPPYESDGSYHYDNVRYGPSGPSWRYRSTPPDSFYSFFISGVQRLPNGNTLICDGPSGRFFEVGPDFQEVWRYTNPVSANGPMKQGAVPINNLSFRCIRYPLNHPAFADKVLSGSAIELNPLPSSCSTALEVSTTAQPQTDLHISLQNSISGPGSRYQVSSDATDDLQVLLIDMQGNVVQTLFSGHSSGQIDEAMPALPSSGMYILRAQSGAQFCSQPFVYLR